MIPLLLLLLSPADAASVSVRGGLTREATVDPGDHAEGVIEVRNDGDDPQQVLVYARDYQYAADGSNRFDEPGSAERSNTGWLSFGPTEVVVPPHGSVQVAWRVEVPESEALEGSYWSMLMVEPVDDDDAPEGTVAVKTVFRYGVQLITHVGGGEADLRFVDRRVAVDGETRSLELDLLNTGEIALAPSVWTEVYAADGQPVGRFESKRLRLLPGCSVRHRLDLSSLPAGTYSALVVADNGDDHVFGSQYTLDLR